MTDGQDGGGAKAIPEFYHWADNRRHKERRPIVPIATFLAGLWLAWVLLWISDAASWLARKAVPRA